MGRAHEVRKVAMEKTAAAKKVKNTPKPNRSFIV